MVCLTYPTLLDSICTSKESFENYQTSKIITFKDLTSLSIPLFDSLCILQLNDTSKLQTSSFCMKAYTILPQCILKITLPVLIQYIILVHANQVKETHMH